MDRDDRQGPAHGVTAHLTIPNRRAREAIDWYGRAFGAEPAMEPHQSDDGRIMHCHLRINGGSLMINDDFPEYSGGPARPPGSTVLHLQVADADGGWSRAIEAGAEVRMPLADQFWGDRYGQFADPFGFTWSIGAPSTGAQD